VGVAGKSSVHYVKEKISDKKGHIEKDSTKIRLKIKQVNLIKGDRSQ
jgi:hypothetical protein